MYGFTREAVRVKVKKCESNCQPEWRKFSVDPQITSVEILHSIVAKAFDIRSDFSMHYKTFDPTGHETFLAVLSDWDLDAAFLRTHNYSVQTGSEPCLNLRVDVASLTEKINFSNYERNCTESMKSENTPLQQSFGVGQKYVQNMQNKLPGLIMNHMEKTFSMVQRALNFAEEQIPIYPPKPPLSDSEFRGFLDSVGQIIRPQELRKVIFLGGIDPSLRKVVWKHILNVYPNGMTGRERMDYMKRKAGEYCVLRDVWKTALQNGSNDSELAYVTSMVKKDVLRTDRLQQFYAGNDDNQNVASLFNILTTYALNHPKVSYCQGMSDLASPLLVTMNDEAHAYICFCAIMERLQSNFMLDGISMTQKFSHLTEALQYYDPEFYEYLKLQQADDLLFCYRWLLLELKREFPFEDSLRMLEVQWSSLRSDPPGKELKLFDKEFVPQKENSPAMKANFQNSSSTGVPNKYRESHYANICALRRQASSISLYSHVTSNQSSLDCLSEDLNVNKLDRFKRLNQSLDENIPRISMKRNNLMKAHQSLDEAAMLLLMRNITPLEDLTENCVTNKNEESEADNTSDINKEAKGICDTKTAVKKVIFHSTNPFINDAQGGSTEVLVCDDKNLEKSQLEIENSADCSGSNILNGVNRQENNVHPESIISAQIINKHRGHFKELKEKIAASKKGLMASIDKIETQLDLKNSARNSEEELNNQAYLNNNNNAKQSPKVVRNLNEFLNLANKSKLANIISEGSFNKFNNDMFGKSNTESNRYKTSILRKQEDDTKSNRPISKQLEQNIDEAFVLNSKIESVKNETNIKSNDKTKDNINALTNVSDCTNTSSQSNNLIIDETLMNANNRENLGDVNINYENLDKIPNHNPDLDDDVNLSTYIVLRNPNKPDGMESDDLHKRISSCSSNNADIFLWENPLHQISRNSTCSLTDIDVNDNRQNSFSKIEETSFAEPIDEIAVISLKKSADSKIIQDLNYVASEMDKKEIVTNGVCLAKTKIEENRYDDLMALNPFLNTSYENSNLETTVATDKPRVFNVELGHSGSVNELNHTQNNASDKSDTAKLQKSNSYSNFPATNAEENSTKFPVNVNIKATKFLPPPTEFGGGNPFLIFLCLTLLLQHRNVIMRNQLDYNEMAMHFDKMVRKHDVNRVLNQARRMYFEYLKTHNALATAKISIEHNS